MNISRKSGFRQSLKNYQWWIMLLNFKTYFMKLLNFPIISIPMEVYVMIRYQNFGIKTYRRVLNKIGHRNLCCFKSICKLKFQLWWCFVFTKYREPSKLKFLWRKWFEWTTAPFQLAAEVEPSAHTNALLAFTLINAKYCEEANKIRQC